MGYELRATGYELRATGYELRAMGYELLAMGYDLRAMGYELWAMGYELWAMNYGLWASLSEDLGDPGLFEGLSGSKLRVKHLVIVTFFIIIPFLTMIY